MVRVNFSERAKSGRVGKAEEEWTRAGPGRALYRSPVPLPWSTCASSILSLFLASILRRPPFSRARRPPPPGARKSWEVFFGDEHPPGHISAMGDYTIQISTKLIDQLARDDEKVKRKARKPKPKKKPTVQPHEEPLEFPREPKTTSLATAPGWPLQPPPMFLPVTPSPPPPPATMPEVEAIRSVLKESEALLKKLENQETGARQELSKRAKELHDKEFKLPYQKPMPCTQERAGCLECYKTNAKDPLKCAEAVKRFEACALMAIKSTAAKAD